MVWLIGQRTGRSVMRFGNARHTGNIAEDIQHIIRNLHVASHPTRPGKFILAYRGDNVMINNGFFDSYNQAHQTIEKLRPIER